jgi:hypothetical protein
MKRLFFLFGSALLIISVSSAQQQNCNIVWSDPIRLSDSMGGAAGPKVALSGDDTVHVIWFADTYTRLPYMRSIDGGKTFEPLRDLIEDTVNFPYTDTRPAILAIHNMIFVFFIGGRNHIGNEPLRMIISSDRGTNWSDIKTIGTNEGIDTATEITDAAINGDSIAIIYPKYPNGGRKIIISTDAGLTWKKLPIYDTGLMGRIGLTSSGLHFINAGGEGRGILYTRSTDLGENWKDSIEFSGTDEWPSDYPSITSYEKNNVPVLWTTWRETKYGYNGDLGAGVASRWGIDGELWQDEQDLSDDQNTVESSLSINDHLFADAWWNESDYDTFQVFVRASQTTPSSFCPITNITPDRGTGSPPMVKVSSHAIHVVWEQLEDDGNFRIYYRKGEIVPDTTNVTFNKHSLSFDTTFASTARFDTVQLTNEGSNDAKVWNIICGSPQFTISPAETSFASYRDVNLVALFNPDSSGYKEGKLYFFHNGKSSPEYVSVSGVGKWPYQVAVRDTPLHFGTIDASESKSGTIHLENTGIEVINVKEILSDNANFSIESFDTTISIGQVSPISIVFNPVFGGSVSGNIIVYHNGEKSPDTIHASGYVNLITTLASYNNGEWNLISTPNLPQSKFTLPSLFMFEQGYTSCDSMYAGRGYWLKPNETVSYEGVPIYNDSIPVKKGWNIVGALANPLYVGSIGTNPINLLSSSFYEYRTSAYLPADTLKPCYGYWVKAKEDGKLIMQVARKKK